MDLQTVTQQNLCSIIRIPCGVDPGQAATVVAQGVRSAKSIPVVFTYTRAALKEQGWAKGITIISPDEAAIPGLDGRLFLDQVRGSYLIFDSFTVATLLIDNRWQQLYDNGNRIIVLTNWLVSDQQYATFHNKATTLGKPIELKADFAQLGEQITFHLHESKMTEYQQAAYLEKRAAELKDTKEVAEGYIRSLQYENMVYPAEERKLLESVPHAGSSHGVPAAQELIRLSGLPDFGVVGRKMYDLIGELDNVNRHIVFTRYAHHYGADLLSGLLTASNVPHVMLTGSVPFGYRKEAIERFNSMGKGAVLITTMTLNYGVLPRDVTRIHMVDGSYNNLFPLIEACYHYVGKVAPALQVHYYVTTPFDATLKETGGMVLYQEHVKDVNRRVQNYLTGLQTSHSIVLHGNRLIVR